MAHSGYVPQQQFTPEDDIRTQLILLKRNLESSDRLSMTYKYRDAIYKNYANMFHRYSNSNYFSQKLLDLSQTLIASNILLAQLSSLAKVLSDNPRFPVDLAVNASAPTSDFDKAVTKCYVQGLDATYNLLIDGSITPKTRNQIVLISNAIGDTTRLYMNPHDQQAVASLRQTQVQMPSHSYLRPIAGTFLVVLGILALAAAIAATTILATCLMAAATGFCLSIGIKMLATDVSDISKSTDQLLRSRSTLTVSPMFAPGPQHQQLASASQPGVHQTVYIASSDYSGANRM